jgi:hypothetical protein
MWVPQSFPGVKRSGRADDNSRSPTAVLNNKWEYTGGNVIIIVIIIIIIIIINALLRRFQLGNTTVISAGYDTCHK